MILRLKKKITLISSSIKTIILILTIALLFDVVVLGNGKWSEVYIGFNFRKVIFFLLTVSLVFYLYIEKTIREEVDYFLILLPIIVFLFGLFVYQ
jgi:hypothetical protein